VETVHPDMEDADFAYACLTSRAEQTKAAYMIMGGYSHSRLSEYMFGGLTRSMLAASSMPLYIAH
jgi:nucleotide-binding universal stress UspA family protein